MGTNYIAPMWRMPENTNKDKLSNYNINWDNTNQSIVTIPLEDFGIDNTFSFSLWVRPGSGVTPTAYSHLFANAALNSGGFGLYMAGNGNDAGTTGDLCFRFYVDNYNISGRFINSDPINLEQWYHVAVAYSDATGASMYVDNASPITGVSGRTAAAPNVPVTIGSSSNPIYGPGYQAKSSISQVCLFDYIISSDQVEYLYNLNNPMVIPGGEPVGYFPVGDNSNPISLACQPNISVGADSVFDFIPNDYINLGTTLQDVLNSNQNTISLWFRSDTASNFDTVFSQGKDQSTGYRFFVSSSDLSLNRAETGSNTRHEVDVAFEHQRWNHLVVVTNTSNTSILSAYLNGDFVGGSSSGSISYSNGGNEAWIGGQSGISQYWDGQISNVQIWNTDLTGPEVTTLYNNGQPLMTGTQPQTANLKAWYKLNQHDSYWDLGGNGKWTFNNAAIN